MPNYILNELFLNLAEFRDSAPNVESSATFQALIAIVGRYALSACGLFV